MIAPKGRLFSKLKVYGILLSALLLLSACTKTSDETAILTAIDSMVEAIERKESRTFIENLDSDFSDQDDRDVKGVRQLLAYHFFANNKINVFVSNIRISLSGPSAVVTFNATTTGAARVIPERGQFYSLETEWRKRDKQWKLLRASWQPLLFQSGNGK